MKKLIVLAILVAGCAPQTQAPPHQFGPGDRVRHVVSKQEGIVTWAGAGGYYLTVRFAVDRIAVVGTTTVKTTEMQEVEHIRGFELEKVNKDH